MKILLLQARSLDDPAKAEERAAFANKAGLPEANFIQHDLLTGPPPLSLVLSHDAMMIGGSGEFNVSDSSLPHMPRTCALLREVVEAGHPTFASCFGFQILVEALGGKIIRDADNKEIGTFPTTLTPAGRADELFGYLPALFDAQFGHKERAEQIPDTFINLAATERVGYQAIRVPGKPIWATQFHPELSGDENRQRFMRYSELYVGMLGQEAFDKILAGFSSSPETEELIPRFLRLIA